MNKQSIEGMLDLLKFSSDRGQLTRNADNMLKVISRVYNKKKSLSNRHEEQLRKIFKNIRGE